MQAEEKATTMKQCSMGVSRGQIQFTCRLLNWKGMKKQKQKSTRGSSDTNSNSNSQTINLENNKNLIYLQVIQAGLPVRPQWVKRTVKQSTQKNMQVIQLEMKEKQK